MTGLLPSSLQLWGDLDLFSSSPSSSPLLSCSAAAMAATVVSLPLPLPPVPPLQRPLSTPAIPSFHSFAVSSSSSSSPSQPLIDHALFMLSLSQRLSHSEGEADRAVEMREDALKLLVLGEEMRKAEEMQHQQQLGSQRSSPHSSPHSSPRRWKADGAEGREEEQGEGEGEGEGEGGEEGGHLIPPAYTFGPPSSSAVPTSSLIPVSPSAISSSSTSPSSSLLLLPSSSSSSSATAVSSSLSTLLVEADAVLVRLHGKWRDYIAPVLDEGMGAVQRLTETEEARLMVEEGRAIVGQWREWMGSREGELRMQSLVALLSSPQLSSTLLTSLNLPLILRFLTGQAVSEAADSSHPPLVPPPSTSVSSSPSSAPFSLSSLPSAVHSFLLAHPALHLLVMRAQSALLSPDSSSASQLDAALSSFSGRLREWLTDVQSTSASSALSLHGRPQLLSSDVSSVLKDVSAPVLRLLRSPELVFSEGVRLLLRKDRREEVFDGLKALLIAQLSTALSSLTFPAVRGSTPSFSYAIDAFSLSSFRLHADDIHLHSSASSLTLTISHVSAETRHVGWQCSQLLFPYLQGGGTMDLRLKDASMHTTVALKADDGLLLLDSLAFRFPSLDFHVGGSGLSSVYNLLLTLFGPIVRAEMEKALEGWSRAKSEQMLDVLNTYGGELINKIFSAPHNAAQHKGDDEAVDGEREGGERLEAARKEEQQPQPRPLIREQLIREVALDAIADALSATAAVAPVPVEPTSVPPSSPALSDASSTSSSQSANQPLLATPPPHRAAAQPVPANLRLTSPTSSSSSPSSSASSHARSPFVSPVSTPSSSSPFLTTLTPPLFFSFHDTASGW